MTEFEKPRISKLPWWSALLTATCILLAVVFHIRWTQPISRWPIDLPMRSYMFFDRPELKDFDSPKAQGHWSGMVNKVWWDTKWQDNKGDQFPRGIDVFHKMHCIIAIREEFVLFLTDVTRAETTNTGDPKVNGKLTINANHLQHCFDFLRQDILCAADMTLEPLGKGYKETDGQGVVHECKDWRLLLDHVGLQDLDNLELR
ncbi:hypothetical protein BKA65DRAFT_540972 [Rhexocercosporidium sp. MPI-PUGE-AT-0058]|nr:hypothetical protein BKA65DRAFT_540972 [Rhexocercosporidium sp. MPI-PUGE-AT-0058]